MILQRSLLTLSIVLRVSSGLGCWKFGRCFDEIFSICVLQLAIVVCVTFLACYGSAISGLLT